jgi:membrane dipeptidase
MWTRRQFIEGAGALAGSALIAPSVFGIENGPDFSSANMSPDAGSPDPKLLERARSLLEQAPLLDTHNDLPYMLVDKLGGDITKLDFTQPQPSMCADIPRLREGRIGAQYWSVFVESATQKNHTSLHGALRAFDAGLRFIAAHTELEQARTADDIERIHKAGKIACLFGVEGGHMIENSTAVLRIFHQLGARYMTLTHWDNVDWADAATDRVDHFGLTEFGKQVVREMNRIGVFIDLSHVSPDVMRDALGITKAPVIFSHSNAYAIDRHARNVPDDILKLVKTNGGVVHVNFIKAFISAKDAEWQASHDAVERELHARLDSDEAIKKALKEWEQAHPYPWPGIPQVADHIDHIREVAGIDHIGIGADFFDDGKESMSHGLENVTRYPYLFAELLRRGYSDEDVMKVAGRNHLRAMRQMEKVAAELQKSTPEIVREEFKAN